MRIAAWVAAGIFILDQLTKFIVVHLMRLDQVGRIEVFDPWLVFQMAWNRGVNFGLFAGDAALIRWGLILLALGISVWVWIWARRSRLGTLGQVATGLLVGGALGNVIDRLVYGAVADFLNMSVPGLDNPYSFNVADVAIFAGALALVLFTGQNPRDARKRIG